MIATDMDTDDQSLDISDEEEETEHTELAEEEETAQAPAAADIDPVIAEEINRVMVAEEASPKAKAQVVPKRIIDEELKPDDWFDAGSI